MGNDGDDDDEHLRSLEICVEKHQEKEDQADHVGVDENQVVGEVFGLKAPITTMVARLHTFLSLVERPVKEVLHRHQNGALDRGGEVAQPGDHGLVQREGTLDAQLKHDGVDAEGEDAEGDAGDDDQGGLFLLHQHPGRAHQGCYRR